MNINICVRFYLGLPLYKVEGTMKIIAQEKIKERKTERREAGMKKMIIAVFVLISLALNVNRAYALLDRDSLNVVIAEQENKEILSRAELMVKDLIKGGVK